MNIQLESLLSRVLKYLKKTCKKVSQNRWGDCTKVGAKCLCGKFSKLKCTKYFLDVHLEWFWSSIKFDWKFCRLQPEKITKKNVVILQFEEMKKRSWDEKNVALQFLSWWILFLKKGRKIYYLRLLYEYERPKCTRILNWHFHLDFL